MAPLKWTTLGEKHQCYNALLKETIAKEYRDLPKISYDDDDIDNLMRIDIACHNRNVDYIFEVLKCSDMLYVTRAIKHSLWLITEPEFAHLINAQYLDTNLFPDMMPKAIAKLLLHIRLNLKDFERAEDFYAYETSVLKSRIAFKWLENCSFKFIETIVAKHAASIPCGVIKRLCRKSVVILEIYLKNLPESYNLSLHNFMFLLKSDTEEFLKIAESFSSLYITINFNVKNTQTIVKRCIQRVINNYEWYQFRIDLETLVKHLMINKIDIEYFVLTNCAKGWLRFDHLQQFLSKMPQRKIVLNLKKLYGISSKENNSNGTISTKIDNDSKSANNSTSTGAKCTELNELFYKVEHYDGYNSFGCVYRWYEFAPFNDAFQDLHKQISVESSHEKRSSMLIILLKSARKDMQFVKKVLQYYRTRHINEPYMHKIVNSVLTIHDAFRFNDDTWTILNEIFYSLEVYIQSNNNVEECIKTIILYNIVNNQPVPEIIEEKLHFDTFKIQKRKLNLTEQAALFDYLYNYWVRKLQSQDMKRETGMTETIRLIEVIWTLLIDWGKEASHHLLIIEYIIKINVIIKELQFSNDIRYLYCLVKPYHKPLFEDSLLLYPCEEMCINALKHDPGLLVRYEKEVMTLCCDESMSVRNLMKKLRIYWRESLAAEWKKKFINNLQMPEGHHALVRDIVVLSPKRSLQDFIQLYAPNDTKILWGESTETEISLQKNIARSMHLARPKLTAEVVMWYAKGDYLQHAQFSLNSVYSNLTSKDFNSQIHKLLNAPVSLQKHGIHIACKRMKIEDLLDIFPSIWKSTRNSSIRTVLFLATFNFLDKTQDNLTKDIWKFLSFMIDDLHDEENKKIYDTLSKLQAVPTCIMNEFYMKSFLFLRDLPEHVGCDYLFLFILGYTPDFIQYLDSNFVENTVLTIPVYDMYFNMNDYEDDKKYRLLNIMTAYLICSKDENTQMMKYKRVLEPMLVKCVSNWKKKKFHHKTKEIFQDFLSRTAQYYTTFIPDINIVMPVKMFECMQNELTSAFGNEENMYSILTQWKLYTAYINILNEIKIEKPQEFNNWETIRSKSINKFSKACAKYLKEDIENTFPSIYMIFGEAMEKTFDYFGISYDGFWDLLKDMLECDDLEVYMLVLRIAATKDAWSDVNKTTKDQICEKIYKYPSKELRIHYFKSFSKKYDFQL